MQKHKHGGDIYSQKVVMDYSANISPLGVPGSVREAIIASLDGLVNYPDVKCRRLREKLGGREGVSPEHILCGNGAAELIFALAYGLKPKRALLASPGFAEYEEALKGTGCEIDFYDLKEEEDFLFQPDYLDAITEETDLVFFCNPNNPTGMTVERDFLVSVLERCRKCNAVLVVDECFNEFLDDPGSMTMKPYLKEYQNLVILKAFTKIYAMPGVRLGYCLTKNEEILDQMRSVMQPWSVSNLAQAAGEAALEEELYVDEVRCLVRGERQFLLYELRKLGLKLFEARANFIFFRGPEGFAEKLLEEGILIRDCQNYRGLCKGYYRIAVKGHRDNERLIKTMEKSLRKRG